MNQVIGGPRILITRLSAIGDCILTLPTACALRRRFPDAFLAWAVEPLGAKVLRDHWCLNDVIVVPKRWLKSLSTIRRLRRQLRAMHFDIAVDPQSLTKSSMLAWLSGAPRRIGFAGPQGRELAPWLNSELVARDTSHIVDASLRLLQPLGIRSPRVTFDIPVNPGAEACIEQFRRGAHLGKGYVVINSGASWPSKTWPTARFGRVARYVGENHHLPSVVTWAGPSESERADWIVAKSGGHAIKAPPTSMIELGSLLRHARMMISSDTGPLHLAAALGTACVALFGPTRHEKCGPYGTRHFVLQSESPAGLNRKRRRTDESAMRAIAVESVCDACSRLLDRQSKRGGQPNAA